MRSSVNVLIARGWKVAYVMFGVRKKKEITMMVRLVCCCACILMGACLEMEGDLPELSDGSFELQDGGPSFEDASLLPFGERTTIRLENEMPNPVRVEVFDIDDPDSVVATAVITTGHSRDLEVPEGTYGVRYESVFFTEVTTDSSRVVTEQLSCY